MKGFHRNPQKVRVPKERQPDLSSTSGARRYLNQVQKSGTPEQLADVQKKVAELHPDMLIERRRA